MSVLVVFIIFLITCYCYGADNTYENSQTKNSKDQSDIHGSPCYYKFSHGGKVKTPVLKSTGQKLVPGINGNYYYKNGFRAFNEYEVQLKVMNETSYMLSKQNGWDFYPCFFVNNFEQACPWDIMKPNAPRKSSFPPLITSWECREMKSGKTFVFYGLENSESCQKQYIDVKIVPNGLRKIWTRNYLEKGDAVFLDKTFKEFNIKILGVANKAFFTGTSYKCIR